MQTEHKLQSWKSLRARKNPANTCKQFTYLTSTFTYPILSSLVHRQRPKNVITFLNLFSIQETSPCASNLDMKFLIHVTMNWYNTMVLVLK